MPAHDVTSRHDQSCSNCAFKCLSECIGSEDWLQVKGLREIAVHLFVPWGSKNANERVFKNTQRNEKFRFFSVIYEVSNVQNVLYRVLIFSNSIHVTYPCSIFPSKCFRKTKTSSTSLLWSKDQYVGDLTVQYSDSAQ